MPGFSESPYRSLALIHNIKNGEILVKPLGSVFLRLVSYCSVIEVMITVNSAVEVARVTVIPAARKSVPLI